MEIENVKVDFCYNDIYIEALMFYEILRDYKLLKEKNHFKQYFAWTQEALLLGLVQKFKTVKILKNDPYLLPFKNWLKLGIPYLKAYAQFQAKNQNSNNFFFEELRNPRNLFLS